MKNCFTGGGPNPNPKSFEVLKVKQLDGYHILRVRYPNCTNFEGHKILLMPGTHDPTRTELDPHFSDDDASPIARFEPTKEGWELADVTARLLAAARRNRRSTGQARGRRDRDSSCGSK